MWHECTKWNEAGVECPFSRRTHDRIGFSVPGDSSAGRPEVGPVGGGRGGGPDTARGGRPRGSREYRDPVGIRVAEPVLPRLMYYEPVVEKVDGIKAWVNYASERMEPAAVRTPLTPLAVEMPRFVRDEVVSAGPLPAMPFMAEVFRPRERVLDPDVDDPPGYEPLVPARKGNVTPPRTAGAEAESAFAESLVTSQLREILGPEPVRVPASRYSEFSEIGIGAVQAIVAASALWLGAHIIKGVVGASGTGGYGGFHFPSPTFLPGQPRVPSVFSGDPPSE